MTFQKMVDVTAVIDGLRHSAENRADEQGPASDEQLGSLAYALRDIWRLKNDKEVLGVARRTFARCVFGVSKLRDLTCGQVQIVIESAKEPAGPAEFAEIRDFCAQVDQDFAKAVGRTDS